MDQKTQQDLLLSAVFWPSVILAVHFLFVRKKCHPAWIPWKATAAFLWNLAWPSILLLSAVVMFIFLLGMEGDGKASGAMTSGLAPAIVIGGLIPIFMRAKRIILAPPSYILPMEEGVAKEWERAAEERHEMGQEWRQSSRAHHAERVGAALGRAVRRLLRHLR